MYNSKQNRNIFAKSKYDKFYVVLFCIHIWLNAIVNVFVFFNSKIHVSRETTET